MSGASYIHGTTDTEQARLTLMNRAINAPAIAEMGLAAGERVLDMGCGLAQLTRMMAREVGDGGAVVGIERDPRQLAEARRQAEESGEGALIDLREGDAYDPPLVDEEWGSFDVVHSRFVLEHLTRPQEAANIMARAAKPGGRIILQDDDHDVIRFSPGIPSFERVWHAYARCYGAMGMDGYIGRRLPEVLHEAGATPSHATWLNYGACAGSELFGVLTENMLGVIEGARETIAKHSEVSAEEVDQAASDYREWQKHPGAAMWYAICYAEAHRPK